MLYLILLYSFDQLKNVKFMKILSKLFVAAMLMLAIVSCKKETCTTCSVVTDAPGASEYYNYCGTESEINAEDIRLKNGCVDLQANYPQYNFNCGCQ